jgi:hypothetical protein
VLNPPARRKTRSIVAFLLVGADALAAYRYIADGRANEIANGSSSQQALTSTPNPASRIRRRSSSTSHG